MKLCTFLVFKATFIFGILLFAYGFFPITIYDSRISNREDIPDSLSNIKFNHVQTNATKLILMVVDALRFDFVDQRMHFLSELVERGKACKVLLKADAPTVTMPRIKSILTGRTSSFLDIIFNLSDQQLLSDSLMYQFVLAKKKIVFYGDNTWGKLFPAKIFHRVILNHDSFFVNDFYEGDKNITRNVNFELQQSDWDILIFHYLGLDHIGHVEGTSSLKISPKLKEMDEIIEKIAKKMSERKDEKILFLITSDHGMRNEGGHGGGTREEIDIPLIFFGDNCTSNVYEDYNQIDITSTLSSLLNLPMPTNNIGKIIHNLITGLSMNEQLQALYYNILNILPKAAKIMDKDILTSSELELRAAKSYHAEFLKSNNNRNLFEKARNKYINLAKDLSGYIKDSVNYFYSDYITIGIIMCTLSTINLILSATNSFNFAYSLKDSKARIILYFALCIVCWLLQNSFLIVDSNYLWFTVPFNTFLVLNLIFSIIRMNFEKAIKSFNLINKYAIFVIIFTISSLLSSSFIEEEHFTWYYCVLTLLLLMAFKEYQLVIKSIITEQASSYVWLIVLLDNSKKWIPLLLSHVFMSKINARARLTTFTNIADFLLYGRWKTLKLIYLGVTLCLTLLSLMQYNRKILRLLVFMATITIFCSRFFMEGYIADQVTEFGHYWCLLLFSISMIIILVYSCFYAQGSKPLTVIITIFVLLLCVAHRLPNLILMSGCICTLNLGFKALTSVHKRSSALKLLIAESLLSYSVGKVFYFYQGNSNYLGTLDIDTGFLGFDSYPVLVGVIVFIRTFSAQILCFSLLLYEGFSNHNKKDLYYSVYVIATYILIRLNIYLYAMVVLKNHLFICSVFSPKFLYEVSELFLFSCLFLLFFSYNRFNQYLFLVTKKM